MVQSSVGAYLVKISAFELHTHNPAKRVHDDSAGVIREGPTTADVYIDISPFYGMAPATVSGYRSGGRRYA